MISARDNTDSIHPDSILDIYCLVNPVEARINRTKPTPIPNLASLTTRFLKSPLEEIENNMIQLDEFYNNDVRSDGFQADISSLKKGHLVAAQMGQKSFRRGIVLKIYEKNRQVDVFLIDEGQTITMAICQIKFLSRKVHWELPYFVELLVKSSRGLDYHSNDFLADHEFGLELFVPKGVLTPDFSFEHYGDDTVDVINLPNFVQHSCKNQYLVEITNIISPHDFHFVILADFRDYTALNRSDIKNASTRETDNMEKEIKYFFDDSIHDHEYRIPFSWIKPNLICAYPRSREWWNRCKILFLYDSRTCRISCIDHGSEFDVRSDSLRLLPYRFGAFPPSAQRARLNRLLPVPQYSKTTRKMENDWTPEAKSFFDSMACGKFLAVVRKVIDDIAYCDLYSTENARWLGDELIEKGYAEIDRDESPERHSIGTPGY